VLRELLFADLRSDGTAIGPTSCPFSVDSGDAVDTRRGTPKRTPRRARGTLRNPRPSFDSEVEPSCWSFCSSVRPQFGLEPLISSFGSEKADSPLQGEHGLAPNLIPPCAATSSKIRIRELPSGCFFESSRSAFGLRWTLHESNRIFDARSGIPRAFEKASFLQNGDGP